MEDIPGDLSAEDSQNATSDVAADTSNGPNWQDLPDEGTSSVAVTEQRQYSANCPFCMHKFTIGQTIQKVSVRTRRMY